MMWEDDMTAPMTGPPVAGAQKAWAAFIIGTVVQSLDIVLSYLPADIGNTRLVLLIIVGVVGTVGQGLGVYQVTNSPPRPPALPPVL